MKFTIDRIEGSFAVCLADNHIKFDIPLEILGKCQEGDVFDILKDHNETRLRTERIKKLAEEVWE